MRKGFVHLIILFSLLATSAVVFLFLMFQNQKTPLQIPTQGSQEAIRSPDPYRGWNKYTNETYEFTIRYPGDWFIKEYQDYAANFYDTDPKEATPQAIKVRFLAQKEKQDIAEFEKVYNANEGQEIREALDVKSTISKIRNLSLDYPAIEYEVSRNFTAPEGPRTEYRHVYEINKEGTILEFLSAATTKEEQQSIKPIFEKIVSSLQLFK